MGIISCMWRAAPFVAMVTVECTDVGLSVISKAAMTKGMSNFVSVVYYNALGTFILLPYFICFRNKQAPLTFSLVCRFFLLGLIGSSGQVMYLTGVKYSSPTLSSALVNLIPIFTFFLAIISRMEKLDLSRSSSRAKSLGAIVSVTGAFVVTLYKGPPVFMVSSSSEFPHRLLLSHQSRWIIGGLLIILTCLDSAMWNVAQAATVREYPEEMTILFFYTFFITIQSAVFSLIFERSPGAWKIKSGIEVTAIVCTAVFGSLFRIGVHTWCLRKKGPVYVAMFKPLGIAIAAVMTVMFLGDTLYLGSVIGSAIIALGFYAVMWGQTKEKNVLLENAVSPMEPSGQKTPLLQNRDIIERTL